MDPKPPLQHRLPQPSAVSANPYLTAVVPQPSSVDLPINASTASSVPNSSLPRDLSDADDAYSDEMGEAVVGEKEKDKHSSSAGPPRKRRRSRKGLEKQYECDAPGCGKRFTRSEHLSRHQLNRR